MAQTNVQAFSGDVEISSNLAVNTDDLFVDTVNSRVGIGTTEPGFSILDVAGTLRVGTDSTSLINLGRTSDVATYRNGYIYHDGTNLEILNQEDGDLKLGTNNAIKMTILANGNVGIGRTNPACALDIAGEDVMIRGNTPSINFSELAGAMDGVFRIRYDGANQNDNNNYLAIQCGASFATTAIHCTLDGKVGIGKANPNIRLDVGNALENPIIGRDLLFGTVHDADKRDAIYFGRRDGTGADFLGMKCRVDTHTALGVGDYSNQTKIEFYTWGNNYSTSREVMSITGAGRVGIGKTNPSQILHVVSNTDIPFFEGDGGRSVFLRDSYALVCQGGNDSYAWDGYPGVVRTTGDGEFRIHGSAGYSVSLRVDGSYLPFTGSHDTYHYYDESDEGKLVYATGDYESNMKTGVYRNEIDIMQACPTVSLCTNEKDKRVVGVLATRTLTREKKEITEKEYHELENEQKYAYSKNDSSNTYVAHIDTNEYSKGMYNALGEGGIWVSNKNGNFENGDYITSSTIPGYGQRQDDDILRNYTAAKITTDCDFTEILEIRRKRLQLESNYQYDENKQPLYENILDEEGNMITQPKFKLRYILPDGTEITKEQYTTAEEAYIAAFVGCTYHCG